jgi:exonuclease VII small subunit
MRRLSVLLVIILLTTACSEPPNKEINRAQGAIDAARAAGGEQYATDAFNAATAALQQSHEAVEQRDYRLALSRAVDAYERAQEAAKLAADGKAKARSEAEMAVSSVNAALLQLDARLKAAEAAGVAPRDLAQPRRVARDAAATLQKARALLLAGNYLEAMAEVKGVRDRIHAEISAVDAATAARAARRPGRRR